MNFRPSAALLAAVALGAAGLRAAEENHWPVRVEQADPAGNIVSVESAGPLIFQQPASSGGKVTGFRPFYAKTENAGGDLREIDVLYPIFTYRVYGDVYRLSIFNLYNRTGQREGVPPSATPVATTRDFDVWPFWFSRETGSPDTSYHGLLPVTGTIKNRFGYDELSWTAFPFYGKAEKNGSTTTATPWPIVKITRGTEQGFQVWPLYGEVEKPGAYSRQYFLWPFGWNNTKQPAPDAPPGTPPRREAGLLPFYTRETDAGFVNETYLWPFFGRTDRTTAPAYHETRYLWPFLVQGRGDDRTVERWAPFYTHSVAKGVDKKWVLWPFYREAQWNDRLVSQKRTELFYFVYWSEVQHSLANPQAAPAAKTHVWPLVSIWDNGAGKKQVQFPSPLEVFFSGNEHVRANWSPLFSVYRYDRRAPDDIRHDLLWGLVTWHNRDGHREFRLGPLLSLDFRGGGAKRFTLGRGLVGVKRDPAGTGKGWRFFLFDFSNKSNTLNAKSR